jgi:hypothetical protein
MNSIVKTFDLDSQTSLTLGDIQGANTHAVYYHLSTLDAISGENSLRGQHFNELSPFQQTIYVRVVNNSAGCVKVGLTFDLIVHPLPVISSSVLLK